MAGHSKFKNIMYRKGAQDKKRASLFAKLGRELMVAARLGGADPAANTRLRLAIATARASSMPKDTIERAVQKGAGGGDDAALEEIRYEGYGPGGVAVIVDMLTNNRNRSAAEIRALFSRAGGAMGESGSVAFLFDRCGEVRYPPGAGAAEAVFDVALEAGADDVESGPDGHEILCAPDALHAVSTALAARLGEPTSCRLVWRPKSLTPVDADQAEGLLKFLDALEDNDDVQHVTANFDIPDAALEALAG